MPEIVSEITIVVVGLNHRTMPLELREKFLACNCTFPAVPASLPESVLLSTCNRLEIYAAVHGTDAVHGPRGALAAWDTLESYLADFQAVPKAALHDHLYFAEGQAAIEHLMNVACGLDSQILGEPQILGQVAEALGRAQAENTVGPVLSHLFAQAIHTGKRAHSETGISRYTTSVSHAAVLLAGAKVGDLSRARVLIVGAGEMAGLAVQALKNHGTLDIRCISRTHAHAEALMVPVGGQAMPWLDLRAALAWADVVISATAAPHTVIYAADVAQALSARDHRSLVFVDVAVPRDVEETTRALPGVQVYDIDDLKVALDANLSQRQAAVPRVQAIVRAEADAFSGWLNTLQVVPVINDLRRKANALAAQEAEWAMGRLRGMDATDDHTEEIINRMAQRLVNKLLHEPVSRLKVEAASGNGYDYASALRDLFDLHETNNQ